MHKKVIQKKMPTFQVVLKGGSPWGFTLKGGSEVNSALSISKIEPGGRADVQKELKVGDIILCINDVYCSTRAEAVQLVKSAFNTLTLHVWRATSDLSNDKKVLVVKNQSENKEEANLNGQVSMTASNKDEKMEVRLRPVKGRESFTIKQANKTSPRPNSWHVNKNENSLDISVKETVKSEKENEQIETLQSVETKSDISYSNNESIAKTLAHYPSSDSINTFSNYRVVTSKSTPSLSDNCSTDDKISNLPSLSASKSTSALDKEPFPKCSGLVNKSVSGLTLSHKTAKQQYSSLDNIAMSRNFKWDHMHSSSMPYYNGNYHDYIYPYNTGHQKDIRKIRKDHFYNKDQINKYEKYEQYNPMFSQNSPKESFSEDIWYSHQVPYSKENYTWNSHGHLHKIPLADRVSPQKVVSPPAPPVRDASSLKYIKYGPGHEKHPSWPVTGSQSNNPGSHRTHSWTEHTDYPKERDPFIRPKKVSESFTPLHPVQEKGVILSNNNNEEDSEQIKAGPVYYAQAATISQNINKPLQSEQEKSKFDFASVYLPWSSYIPAYDSEGHGFGDKDYNVPSPPERDVPACGTDGQSGISQKELDDYAKKYDDVLQHYVKTGSIQRKIELFENSKRTQQKKIENVPSQNSKNTLQKKIETVPSPNQHHQSNFNPIDFNSNYVKQIENKDEVWKSKNSDTKNKDNLQRLNHLAGTIESSTPLMDRLCQETQHFENMDVYQQRVPSIKENIHQNNTKWIHAKDFCSNSDFVKSSTVFLNDHRQASIRQSPNKKSFKVQTAPQRELPDRKPVESIVRSSKVQLPQRYFSESVLHYNKDSFTKNQSRLPNIEDKNCDEVFYPCSPSSGSDSRRSSDSFIRSQGWLDQEEKKNRINSLQYHIHPENNYELKKSSSFSSSSIELDSRSLSPVSDQIQHAQSWHDKQFLPIYDKRNNFISTERKDSFDEKSKNSNKHSFFDPSKKHKISDPELKAIQKEAVRSFIEMKTGSQSSNSCSSGSFRINESKPCWDVARIQHLPDTKPSLSPSKDSHIQENFFQNETHDVIHLKPKSQSLPRDYYAEFKQYQKKHDQEQKQKLRFSLEGKGDKNSKSKLEAVPEQLSFEEQTCINKNRRSACPNRLDIPVSYNDPSKWSSTQLSPVSPSGPPPPYDNNHAKDWYKKKLINQSVEHQYSQNSNPISQNLSYSKYSPINQNPASEGIAISLMYKSENNLEAPVFAKTANISPRAKPHAAQIHHAKLIESQMSPTEDYCLQSKNEANESSSSASEIIGKSHKSLYQENGNLKTTIIKEEIVEKCVSEKLNKTSPKTLKALSIVPAVDQTSWNKSDSFQNPGSRNSIAEDSLAKELPLPVPASNLDSDQTVDIHRDDCSSPEFSLPPPPIADSEIIEDIPLPPPPLPEEMAFKLQPSAFTLTYYKDSYMQYRNERHPVRKGFGGEYTRSTPTSPSEVTQPPQFVVSASSSSLSSTAWEKEHNIGRRSSTVVFNSVDLYSNSNSDTNSTYSNNYDDCNNIEQVDDENLSVNGNETIKEQNSCETEINSNTVPDKLLKDVKCEDELECDKLSADLCRQLNDKTLALLLIPTNHKTTADYMEGLFEMNIDRDSQLNRRLPNGSPKKISVSAPLGSLPQKRLSDTSLPPTSAYFTTSESKAKLLTRFNRDIRQEALNSDVSSAELDKKKEDLIQRIDQKLKVLGTIQESIKDEIRENEELGLSVTVHVEKVAKPNEIEKYKRHIEELDKITNLLLSLSGRLARAENALISLAENTSEEEKKCLIAKRDKLLEQHEDAKKLKESIDQRSHQVAQFLKEYLLKDEFEDYNHFVKMKSKLIMDAREIDDKIKLGLEQLNALKNSLSLFCERRS